MDTPTTPEEVAAHNAAMTAKADANTAKTAADVEGKAAPEAKPAVDPNRPAWLPEGFDTPEEFAAEYEKLKNPEEAPETTPKEGEEAEPKEGEEAPKEGEEATEEAAEKVVEEAGLNMADLSEQYAKDGELGEDNYKALEKAGVPREYVDQYIAGQKALIKEQRAEVLADIGGEEGFKEAAAWAGENWTDEQLKSFNATTSGTDLGAVNLALKGLKADYDKANGVSPKLLDGRGQAGESGGYKSQAEVKKAMADPRYRTDSAYRDAVIARVHKT